MKLKIIACKVFYRELSLLSARSPHFCDLTWIRQGYHDTPDLLRKILQEEIDRIDEGDDPYTTKLEPPRLDFDAIIILYGLCSNGILELHSKRYKLVVPRTHDCIAILLGSRAQYDHLFNHREGIYWYSPGWMDCTSMPGRARMENTRADYARRFGEDNADYLMEMEQGWIGEYNHCIYIDWPDLGDRGDVYKREAAECAAYLDWQYEEVEGDLSYMRDLLDGNWQRDDILVLDPGQQITPSYDENIIGGSAE